MSECGPLGLGLIGCGSFGRFCLDAFSTMPQVRPAAVADTREEVVAEFARDFAVAGHTSADALIARDDVHIVHVATPPSSHHEWVRKAVAAGKHVLCEKPLALTAARGREVLSAAEAAGVCVSVNFVLRYNRVTEAVGAVIESGVLGEVLSARLTNCAKDTPLGPDHWFWLREVSGGIFIEHGVHFFDLYAHWLGPGEVIAAHAEVREATSQEDRVTCTVRHAGGAVASHYHGFDQYYLMDRTDHRLVCELGDIRVDGWVPLRLTVDALTDASGADRLSACCGGAPVEVIEDYGRAHEGAVSRGKPRAISRRVRLCMTPEPDKPTLYAASIRELMADQVAAIRNPSHPRRVTGRNGLDSLVLAERAAQLAAAGR